MGTMFQNGVTVTTGPEMWAPSAALSRTWGPDAGGSLDALGCIKGGDVTKFKSRRQVELKHGRAAMLAAMGFITPEYFRFPVLLSVSSNLKFADLPSGLAALSEMTNRSHGSCQWEVG